MSAFGERGARAVLRTLGPADPPSTAPRRAPGVQAPDCNSRCGAGTCSCSSVCCGGCNWTDFGCGALWLAPRSGLCN
ncbi:bacteriocin fulvocin C-related protein [Streptomyces sp. SID335]|nr:bacteriocin fulvocin C-related protein [Streptomyces sp. SID335]MYZ18184.1 bacteriocin fulvocin C-related protein [Streptomyces sp. SID337]NDZ85319.1 bacteriocin fulvocin C-related protein [Streptomyces sp. SID10115]NEB46571.1 bacteriocin fulvocin C-related protein [Streptomyces sp. SID339]